MLFNHLCPGQDLRRNDLVRSEGLARVDERGENLPSFPTFRLHGRRKGIVDSERHLDCGETNRNCKEKLLKNMPENSGCTYSSPPMQVVMAVRSCKRYDAGFFVPPFTFAKVPLNPWLGESTFLGSRQP